MRMDDTSLREALRAESESFRKLEEMHGSLDKKLVALSKNPDHSPENEIEEKRLKKLKLKVKDEMYRMMRQYAEEQKSAS
ncbi:MAG: DUF465 domain-containing protein [Candidatus Coatesbacteria bacterium]|nr:MAG: DUF465 domain-containing protein [Candidatus Coatesbacteria bacterium]